MSNTLLFATFVFVFACGPSGGAGIGADAGDDPGGSDGGDNPAAPDAGGGGDEVSYACAAGPSLDGTWQHANISNTATTMGFHGRQAHLNNAEDWAVWAEVAEGSSGSDMEIMTGSLSDGIWTGTPLTNAPGVQNTFPAVASDGNSIFLVWNGRQNSADDNDIYMATYDGSSWSTPVDLTSGAENTRTRRDYRPSIAIGPDGSLLIAYLSSLLEGDSVLPEDVAVIHVAADGTASLPEIVHPGDVEPCSEVAVAVDVHGTGHILASCGPVLPNHLVYGSNLGGDWGSAPINLAGAAKEFIPRMVADGTDLHIAFRADLPCATGSCGEIFYAKKTAAGFAPAINISNSAEVKETLPVIAVDSLHRPVIGYVVPGADDTDVHLSWCTDAAQFSTPINITPDSVLFRDDPTQISFQPGSGLPIVTYNRVFRGSDPLNVEIFSAELSGPGVD